MGRIGRTRWIGRTRRIGRIGKTRRVGRPAGSVGSAGRV